MFRVPWKCECMEEGKVIKRGAEATVTLGYFLGRRIVQKKRERKRYRDGRLDARLIRLRTRNEVRSMAAARSGGMRIPWIYDVDLDEGLIYMEFIDGERLNTLLYRLGDVERHSIEQALGREIARLHRSGIAHGDLTTSNIIARGKQLYFIDFSMATRPADAEQQGVDLRLLKEVFKSTHSEFEPEFAEVLKGYLAAGGDRSVVDKVAEMEKRARYV